MVERRLPSEVIGLHLERDGAWLRFYNPATGIWLPTQAEREMQLEAERERAEAERKSEKDARQRAEPEQGRLAAELQRLRHEMERLRRSGDEASR